MMKWFRVPLVVVFLLMTAHTLALAELEWTVLKQQTFEKSPRDVAFIQADGRLVVLLDGGEIQILSAAGELQDRLKVDPGVTSLAVSPDGQLLYLANAAGRRLQIVELAYVYDLPINKSPIKGKASAPITLTVFSDFQCPYCARIVDLLDQLSATYPDQLKVVFKQFPLRMHKYAEAAAVASLAARDQGLFWPMHDLLFGQFNQLDDAKIRELAKTAGLNLARFDRDIKKPAYRQEIAADMQLGQQAGVRGTPTLFLNGKLVRERDAQGFKALIERELAKAGKK